MTIVKTPEAQVMEALAAELTPVFERGWHRAYQIDNKLVLFHYDPAEGTWDYITEPVGGEPMETQFDSIEELRIAINRYRADVEDPGGDTSDLDGFLHDGTWVIDPTSSECMRFEVNPNTYYGKAYREWVAKY